MPRGLTVFSATGEAGQTTGGAYPCRLEGCPGKRIAVRWPDGRVTHPCSRGMKWTGSGWRIPDVAQSAGRG